MTVIMSAPSTDGLRRAPERSGAAVRGSVPCECPGLSSHSLTEGRPCRLFPAFTLLFFFGGT